MCEYISTERLPRHIPLQSKPFEFSTKPSEQEQEKLPSVFVHDSSHPPLLVSHSFKSAHNQK